MAQASVDCNDTGGSVLSEPQSSAWKCPTIDFHHHLLAHEGYVDQLLMAMDAAGIDKVCLNGLGVPSANWLGDTSSERMRQSCGFLVNYVYDLGSIEKNHEAYVKEHSLITSDAVAKLAGKGETFTHG